MLRRKYREIYYFFSFRFMSTSLSSVVDNLPEKKKKKAKDSRKKEKSNQYAILRCKECKKIQLNQ